MDETDLATRHVRDVDFFERTRVGIVEREAARDSEQCLVNIHTQSMAESELISKPSHVYGNLRQRPTAVGTFETDGGDFVSVSHLEL